MNVSTPSIVVAGRLGLALSLLALAACQGARTSLAGDVVTHDPSECVRRDGSLMSGDGVFAVTGGDASHHRLRFTDGQLSRNDSCMIRLGNGLNRRVPPLYVNGEPVGFC